MKGFSVVVLCLSGAFLISCQTVQKMSAVTGGGRIESGTKELFLSPALVSKNGGVEASSIELGARYIPDFGENLIIELCYDAGNGYHSITAMDVTIDGKKRTYQSSKPNEFTTGSYINTGVFIVPISDVKEMIAAKDCRIRMVTKEGSETCFFHVESGPGGEAFAKQSLRKFLGVIEEGV